MTNKLVDKRIVLPILIVSLFLNFLLVLRELGVLGGLGGLGEEKLAGRVVRVIDGDTFDLEGEVRVRLAGAEAPEYPEGCLGTKTKERLEELVLGKEVTVEVIEEDNFGRQIGFVKVDEVFVDKVLVEEGLARAASGENPSFGAALLAAEDSARQAKRGIWSSLCMKEGCLIKGNVRRDRGTKVYHLSDCYNYEKIVVNERGGDQWFCSEEEAKKAGFRKSEDCPE
ncbi:thermonuclease family protein [Patescibacteria group bacterium]|nr:thermonuclease family protein [Patescibacteria group bacterium]